MQRRLKGMKPEVSEFFHDNRIKEKIPTGTTVFLRLIRAEESRFPHLLPRGTIAHPSREPCFVMRAQFSFREAAEFLTKVFVLVAKDRSSHS
jgi:hypothetical protein